jgi:hypothetical protein
MPYVNKPRPYKKEYQQQKARGEHDARMRRQKHRREIDKEDTGSTTKKSPRREGKHVSHASKGAKGKYKLENPSKNMSRNYKKKK